MEYCEMIDFLKQRNKTDEEMQIMWDYCLANGHKLICQLNKCGKTWSDLNKTALATLEVEYNKVKADMEQCTCCLKQN